MDNRTVWAKMPSAWVASGQLKYLAADDAGIGNAALKVYLSMAMTSNFSANETFGIPGCTNISYRDIHYLTGLSHSYIKKGIDLLLDLELIIKDDDWLPNRIVYVLMGYDDPEVGWAKVPASYLRNYNSGGHVPRLAETPNRGRIALDSMKVYITLLAFRPNPTAVTMIAYEKLEGYTGIPRRFLRKALDRLVVYSFIHINRQPDTGKGTRSPNEYYMCGNFLGYKKKSKSK